MIILLDSGPLGLVTNPRGGTEAQACKLWLRSLPDSGHLALLPEIIDYEHRRELLLAGLTQAITRLDIFKANGAYVSVSETPMFGQQTSGRWPADRVCRPPTDPLWMLM